MKTASEMTQSVLERKHAYERKKRTQTKIAASALALILVCGTVVFAAGKGTRPQVTQAETTQAQSGCNLPVELTDVDRNSAYGYKEIISLNDDGGNACYYSPGNGSVLFSYPLQQAMERYGDSVRYRLKIHLFRDGKLLDSGSAEAKEIADRLSSEIMENYIAGLSVITYKGADGDIVTDITHDGAEKGLIENFPVGEDYGCFLWLYASETDDTGSYGTYNGGFVSADAIGVLRHKDKLYYQTERFCFSKNPTTEQEYELSEFEDFKKEYIGGFIGIAKNDVDSCLGESDFENELSSNIHGEVYSFNDADKEESDTLIIITPVIDGYVVSKMCPEN